MATPQPDLVETARDVPVTLWPLANDSPSDLLVVAFQQPSFGSVTFDAEARSFTYTPAPGFVGEDSFDYTVRDPAGTTATATVTIRVVQPNRPPVAVDDVATVPPDGVVEIDPLANDSDPDGDPLSLVALGMPEAGSVTVLDGGRLRYAPRIGFTGQDSFTYTVRDPKGASAPATVRIRVETPNRPPVAGHDRITATTGVPVTIDLVANDSDPDGEPLTLTALGTPEHGSLSFLGQGRVTYTSAPGFEGTDRFDYTIGDGRGGFATGEVEILVSRSNAAPVARDDSATTEAGSPVTLDLLANDTDSDGDPLTLVGLSVPARGRLAVAADQRVTYTPDAGFLGTDSFTYTVRDPRGATASATATVTVTPPAAPSTFLNGYRYRRRIVIPRHVVRGTVPLAGFPLLVLEEGPWLRSTAHGGRVETAQGYDLRFELENGTKLPHDVERYDPITGRLIAWVRLNELRPNDDLVLFLYYGKAGLAGSEADPAATWRDYLAVWHLPDPTDRTGRGRDLLATAVSTAEGPIGAAGRFDGTGSELTLADPSFLDGHTALTVQLWVRSDRLDSDRGLLVCGPITGRDLDAAFVLRHATRGLYSSRARVLTVEMALADGRIVYESSPGRADDARHALALVFDRGEGATLVVDGIADTPSYVVGSTLLGPTRIGRGPLRIGTGPLEPSAGRWLGLIDELRVRASALPAAWLAMEHANQRDPASFYGIGGEDAFDDPVAAPVAVPLAASTALGASVVLDPLAAALLPGGGSATLVAVGTPTAGTAVIEAGKIRYTPPAGFTGTARFTFEIRKDGKTSIGTATVLVEVRAAETSAEQDRPFADRLYGNPYHADSLATRQPVPNGPVAKRFLADRTGTLAAVRWPCQITAGDGGEVVVKVETDYQGKPSGLAIGTTAINGGAGSLAGQGPRPLWSFEQPVPVEAGRAYHLVWYQLAASGRCAVVHHRADVPIPTGQNLRGGPYEGDGGTIHHQVSSLWQPGNEHGGFLQLVWSDGVTTGNPIVAGSPGLKKSFGGPVMIRERFTVADYTRKIDGVWLRVWWESGTPSDLLVRLETLEGTLLEQLAVPRSALSQTRNVAGDATSPPAAWVYRRFTRTHTLERGRSYALRLSASTGNYVVHAVQRSDLPSREQWPQAWAEVSTNGGSAWRGWDDGTDPSGVARTDCHLPLAFTLAGSLERLGVDSLIGTANWNLGDFRRLAEDAGVGDDLGEARTVANGGTAWAHLGFPTPSRPPVGRQTFRIRARCSVAGGAIKVELLENGVLRRDLGTQPLGTSFSTLNFTWDASLLGDPNGAGVELKLWLVDNLSSGFYVVDAVDWLADPAGSQSAGGGGDQQPGSELPAPLRTVPVANASQLSSALANAQPGDHIVLADGTYNGTFTLSVPGTAAHPIVVKAASKLGATISGSVRLNANYQILWGLRFSTGAFIPIWIGNYCKVLRCKFDGGHQVENGGTIQLRGTDCEIAYCEFLNHRTRAIDISVGGGARRALIRRNWFHDVIETSSGRVYNAAIRVGTGDPDGSGSTVAACVIEYNLFERYPGHVAETVSLKTSGNILRFNTLLNSKNSTFMCRHGSNNTVVGNWIENDTNHAGGINVMQNDHIVLGNRVVSPCQIRIFAGNRSPYERAENYSPQAMYPAAWNTIVAGNNGPLVIGAYYSSANPPMTVNAKNTSIEAHTGPITYQRHENTTVSPATSREVPQPVKLAPWQVGPDAS